MHRFFKMKNAARMLVIFVALALLFSMLGGCKLFMPAEIRGIETRLGSETIDFAQENPGAFHDYEIGRRKMHYVEVSAVNSPKPLIIFVHGSPGDWVGWVEYLSDPEIRRQADMIAVDRPGFGGSGEGDAEKSLAQQCRDIEPLLKHAAPGQRILLVGHSYGGPVVCRMAMDCPDKVTDVIILAGAIDPGQEKTEWYQYPADWIPFRWLIPTELVSANREIRALKGGLIEMLPLWQDMRQRVTVIQGEADKLVPPENADFAKSALTNAQSLDIIRIPGQNHFLPWNQYGLVKSNIISHLK